MLLPIAFYDPATVPLDPGNLVEITDHTAAGLARLIPEYQDTPRWQAWIAATLARIQEIEAAAFDVWALAISLTDSVGSQLDLIGEIVREDRDGRTDAVYRLALRVRVLINKSQGRIEDLIRIVRLFEDMDAEAGSYVRIRENSDTSLEVRIVSTPENAPSEIRKRLRQAKAGGVGLQTIVTPSGAPLTRSFVLSRAADYPEKDVLRGLDYAGGVGGAGGYLSHVLG